MPEQPAQETLALDPSDPFAFLVHRQHRRILTSLSDRAIPEALVRPVMIEEFDVSGGNVIEVARVFGEGQECRGLVSWP